LLDLGFPLFVVERSALLVRDLDLLVQIARRSWVGVTYSISNVDPILKRAFEPRSPGVKSRLLAMASLAQAGILVGTSIMPIIPLLGDDERHLDELVRATRDHGGSFVIGSGMTMDGLQARRTLEAFRQLDPELEPRLRALYGWRPGAEPRYGPERAYAARLGLLLRELCARHGLLDRMPRHVADGPLALNKRIAERLFLKTFDLELEQASDQRIWAYRRAAWTVDEWPASIAELHRDRGEAGLLELPGIGPRLAELVSSWLRERLVDASREA